MNRIRALIIDYPFSTSLAVLWVGTTVVGGWLRAPLATEITALILLVGLSVRFLLLREKYLHHVPFLALCSIPVGMLLISAMLSDSPRVALLGGEPLWQGWILWAGLLGWFAYAMIAARRHSLFVISCVLATIGTLSSAWALAQTRGILLTRDALSSAPCAGFDNPNSLAQVLVVTLGATFAVLTEWKRLSVAVRAALIGAYATQIIALYASHSWAAVGAVGLGILFFMLQRAAMSRSHSLSVVSAALLVVFLGAFTAALFASSGAFGPGALRNINVLLSGRPEVWESATERVLKSPIIGSGPSEFRAVTEWHSSVSGDITYVLTYDPHGLVVDWLVAGGFVGMIAFGIVATVLALAIARVARDSERRLVHALAATVAASSVSMLVAWPEPFALFAVTTLVGALLALGARHEEDVPHPHSSAWFIVPSLLVAVAVFTVLVLLTPAFVGDFRAFHSRWRSVRDEVDALATLNRTTADAYYFDALYSAVMEPGDAGLSDDEALRLVRNLDEEYDEIVDPDDVEIPLLAAEILWIRRDSIDDREYWVLTQRFARRGRAVDSTLSVWDFIVARAAVSLDRPDAKEYVEKAAAAIEPTEADAVFLDRWRSSLPGGE